MDSSQVQVLKDLAAHAEQRPAPDSLSDEALTAYLADRQTLLDTVQALNLTALPTQDQEVVGRHLRTLQEHTEQLLALLQSHLDNQVAQRTRLLRVRNTLRGYQPALKRKSRAVDRRA